LRARNKKGEKGKKRRNTEFFSQRKHQTQQDPPARPYPQE
jgi:hypothetical protein